MKKLREMYVNGLYTENSEEVYNRFRVLLGDDFDNDDDGEYNPYCYFLGLPQDERLRLAGYDSEDSYPEAVYLTNEEFFNISLGDDEGISIEATAQTEIQAEDLTQGITTSYPFKQFDYVNCLDLSEQQVQAIIDQMVKCGAKLDEDISSRTPFYHYLVWCGAEGTYFGGKGYLTSSDNSFQEVLISDIFKDSSTNITIKEVSDSVRNLKIYPEAISDEEVCELGGETVGSLLEQLQKIKTPNSPDITIDSEGKLSLFFLINGDGLELDVSGKSAEEIDTIYNAANVLMNV